jgi:glutathionyl-hydroquinone reductase
MNITPTESFSEEFWAYNLPLQIFIDELDDESDEESKLYRIVNYMPRKDGVCDIDALMTKEEMQSVCKNSAEILRNLASLFDAFAEGKLEHIYYPDKPVSEAIEEFSKNKIDK